MDNMSIKKSLTLGCIASDGIIEGEVVNIGRMYATIIVEGIEHRIWTKDLERVDGHPKRNQLYKESFIFKGYQTRNFNRILAEHFKGIAKDTSDSYGVLRCIKAVDALLETTEISVCEDFSDIKSTLEQTKKYSDKFGWHPIINACYDIVSETCLKYAILEGAKFATTDTIMIARMIASIAEMRPQGIEPVSVINHACLKLRTLQLTPQGWELLGRMLNVATEAGIRWSKDIFPASQQDLMKLR
jgi:hypothetical protein